MRRVLSSVFGRGRDNEARLTLRLWEEKDDEARLNLRLGEEERDNEARINLRLWEKQGRMSPS